MLHDFQILGEHAVYPGHPITLALLVVNNFASLDEAKSREGRTFPAALECSHIPGAGGNVYSALDFLHHLKHLSWDDAVKIADDYWFNCDSQGKGGYPMPGRKHDPKYWIKRCKEGQAQADRLKKQLQLKVKTWKL